MNNRWAASTLHYWGRMVVGNVSAALVVVVAFSGVTWNTPWRQLLQAFAIALLFSFCIGPALASVMPRLDHWCGAGSGFPSTGP